MSQVINLCWNLLQAVVKWFEYKFTIQLNLDLTTFPLLYVLFFSYLQHSNSLYFLSCLAGIKRCHWKYILSASLCAVLVLAVVGLLLWYFCKLIWISLQLLDIHLVTTGFSVMLISVDSWLLLYVYSIQFVYNVCVFAVYYQCFTGKSCRSGGVCLSASQWCDGVRDCLHGEDEAQCCMTLKSTPQSSTHTASAFVLNV